jgi:hypothetical protein
MIGFQVEINGEKACIAGFEQFGVLTAIVSWVGTRTPGKNTNPEQTTFHVGGLADRVSGTDVFVDWVKRSLSVGDEVRIKIVDAVEFDEPIRRYSKDPNESVDRTREYYEQLKGESKVDG